MADLAPAPDRRRPPAPQKMPPDHIGGLIGGLIAMFGGGFGLYQLVTTRFPRIDAIWLFFLLLHVSVTGLAIPFVRYLNVRFTPVNRPLPPGGVIVRQSVWIGFFVVTCAWLQIPRVLSWPVAIFVALVFIVLEIFLRSRELSHEFE